MLLLAPVSTLLSVVGLACVVTLIAAALFYAWFMHKIKHPQFPYGSPAVSFPLGNISDYSHGMVKAMANTLQHANDKGLASMWLFTNQGVVVSWHEHVLQVFQASTYRANVPILHRHFTMFLGPSALVNLMGDEWKFHRKLIGKAFNYARLENMSVDMMRCGKQLCNSLKAHIPKTQGPVDVFPWLKAMTLDVIGLTAFGYEFNSIANVAASGEVPPATEAFSFLLEELTRRQYGSPLHPFHLFYWLPTAANIKHKQSRELLRNVMHQFISDRLRMRANRRLRQSGEGGGAAIVEPLVAAEAEEEHEDFLKLMLDANEGEEGGGLSAAAMVDNIFTIMFAGFDTTSITLAFALIMLAQNPPVLARLRAEVDSVLGEQLSAEYQHKPRLKYTLAVVKEALRLHPPAPYTARTLTKPLVLDGPVLPAGTFIHIPVSSIHRSPHNYPDPDVCRPERFLEEEEKSQPVPLGAWVPFAAGARTCLGDKFALLEATLLLATFVRQFDFALPKDYVLESHSMGVVQVPLNGVPLTLQPRP